MIEAEHTVHDDKQVSAKVDTHSVSDTRKELEELEKSMQVAPMPRVQKIVLALGLVVFAVFFVYMFALS